MQEPPLSQSLDLSFVIPARNEIATIRQSVESVHRALAGIDLSYEIFVVDNASTDGTGEDAAASGATVLSGADARTVAASRNLGAGKASGRVLVFLDADVTLAPDWGDQYVQGVRERIENESVLSGSEVSCPDRVTWIERIWFRPSGADSRHINSGHMILRRDLFETLGGFDGSLPAGEDFELSRRCERNGIALQPQPAVRAVHHGYPKTLGQFFKREIWHGAGDARGIWRLRSSKVGLIALALLASLVASTVWAAASRSLLPLLLAPAVLLLASGAAAIRRPRGRLAELPGIMFLYAAYLLARACSFLAVWHEGHSHGWKGGARS